MKDTTSDRIGSDPRFKEVAERRNRLAWTLFAITMTLYFGLILTATLNPSALTTPISGKPGRDRLADRRSGDPYSLASDHSLRAPGQCRQPGHDVDR